MATENERSFNSVTPRAGNDAVIKMNTPDGVVVIGWATGVSFDEDYELQGFRTLGQHGDIGHKSLGYTLNIRISTFGLIPEAILNGKFENVSETKTIVPVLNRKEILKSGELYFDIFDPDTNKLLVSLEKCKMSTSGVSIQNNSFITRETAWKGITTNTYRGDPGSEEVIKYEDAWK